VTVNDVIAAVRALPDKTCMHSTHCQQHISKPLSVSSLRFSPAFSASHCWAALFLMHSKSPTLLRS